MPTITELIEDYQEGDFLDFKREEYGKAKKHELVKDVLAFANSEHIGDKYIIIGLKKNGEQIELFDVRLPEDSANIQSIIHDNIKPDLRIEYFPYMYKDHNLVILTILNPTDKPYSTKKVVANPSGGTALAENSCKIRKGSRIKDISRDDLDKIYINKAEQKPNLNDKIKIKFIQNGDDKIQLKSTGNYKLPSEIELDRLCVQIEQVEIESIQNELNKVTKTYSLSQHILSPSQRVEYLKLEKQLVKERFRSEDAYYLDEVLSHKLQFTIYNNADFTLQKPTVIIEIEPFDGLHIMDKIYTHSGEMNDTWYPHVKKLNNGGYVITANVSEIKHKLALKLLSRPLRLILADNLKGTDIRLKITLHAENYHDVLIFHKHIKVI